MCAHAIDMYARLFSAFVLHLILYICLGVSAWVSLVPIYLQNRGLVGVLLHLLCFLFVCIWCCRLQINGECCVGCILLDRLWIWEIIYTVYIHNDSFPIKSAFLPPFRFKKRNLSELCSDNMHFKLIDMITKGM